MEVFEATIYWEKQLDVNKLSGKWFSSTENVPWFIQGRPHLISPSSLRLDTDRPQSSNRHNGGHLYILFFNSCCTRFSGSDEFARHIKSFLFSCSSRSRETNQGRHASKSLPRITTGFPMGSSPRLPWVNPLIHAHTGSTASIQRVCHSCIIPVSGAICIPCERNRFIDLLICRINCQCNISKLNWWEETRKKESDFFASFLFCFFNFQKKNQGGWRHTLSSGPHCFHTSINYFKKINNIFDVHE